MNIQPTPEQLEAQADELLRQAEGDRSTSTERSARHRAERGRKPKADHEKDLLFYDPQSAEWGIVATSGAHYDTYSWDDDSNPLREVLLALLEALPQLERECILYSVLTEHSLTRSAALVHHDARSCTRTGCVDHLGVDRKTLKKYRDLGIKRLHGLLSEPWVVALIGRQLPVQPVARPLSSASVFARVIDSLTGTTSTDFEEAA